jgi:hypothetical protein
MGILICFHFLVLAKLWSILAEDSRTLRSSPGPAGSQFGVRFASDHSGTRVPTRRRCSGVGFRRSLSGCPGGGREFGDSTD